MSSSDATPSDASYDKPVFDRAKDPERLSTLRRYEQLLVSVKTLDSSAQGRKAEKRPKEEKRASDCSPLSNALPQVQQASEHANDSTSRFTITEKEIFDRATRLASRLFDDTTALISLVEADCQSFLASSNLGSFPFSDTDETPLEFSFCVYTLGNREPLVVSDALQDPQFKDHPAVTGQIGIRFYAGVPLISPEGHHLGTLCVLDTVPHTPSAEQLDDLQTLAQMVMSELNHRRRIQREQETRDALERKTASLEEKTSQLQGLADAIPGVIYQFYARPYEPEEQRQEGLDREFTYGAHYVGGQSREILGLAPQTDDIFDQFVERLPEEHRDRFLASVREAVQHKTPWTFETPFRRSDDDICWIRGRSSPVVRDDEIVFNGVLLDVTERVQSEQRFERYMEHANELLSVHDWNSVFLYASSAAQELTGYAPDELLGRSAFEIIHPDDHAHVAQHQARVLAGADKTRFEYRLLRADGSVEWVEVTGGILQLETGERQLFATTRSIQERKEAEEQLQHSRARLKQKQKQLETERERLELALAGGRLGLWDVDYNTGAHRTNDRWATMLGYAPEELEPTFETFLSLLHKEDRARVMDVLKEHVSSEEKAFEQTFRMRAADGAWRWILSRGRVVAWNEDGTARRAVGTHMDITPQKEREAALERSQFLLRESQRIAHLGHFVWNVSESTLQWSRETYRIFGFPVPEAAASEPVTLAQYFAAVHPDDREAMQEAAARTLQTTKMSVLEHRIIRPDGTQRVVEIRGLAMERDQDGHPTRVIGTALDITERKKRERELIEAKEQAEEASRLKSAVVANMSHEVRTPLTSIIGFAEVLEEECIPSNQPFVSSIRRSSARLEDTLSSVLQLSKLEAGAQATIKAPVDAATLVEDVRRDHDRLAAEAGVTLRAQTEGPSHIISDLEMVRRILTNLVSNAIKFTEAGGKVVIRCAPYEEGIQLQVEDTGIGMSADFQERMFNAFEQESTGNTRRYEGSGLGLAIVRRLVELLGGSINVESQKGVGTRFIIELPREIPS
jgi:PAS domain S-box-containing protein